MPLPCLSTGSSSGRRSLLIGNISRTSLLARRPSLCSTAPRRITPTMVEGHQCHRVGHAHRRLLLGKRFIATSPNGRFAEGAAAISGKVLSRIEVHGKNLFYFFGGSSSSSAATSAQQQQQQVPLLQPVDEDPLQPGALDDDSQEGTLDTAAAAAAAPNTPARSSMRGAAAAAAGAGAASPGTPSKSLLAAAGSAAAAALRSRRQHASPAAAAAPSSPLPFSPLTPAAAAAGPLSSPKPSHAAADSAEPDSGPDSEPESQPESGAESESDVVVVHIHFGMSGAFRTASLPGPEPTPTTRLRLVHEGSGLMAHLSAMTVAHGGLGLYRDKVSKLGPDPLRPDDDGERFWARVQGSKKPIGLLLMDQTAVAGVGNIYRAEILYKTRLHPEQPGHTVDRETFEVLWGHCVDLLQRGFTSGSILTVDPEDARRLGKPWTRRYIYNQRSCGRCRGPVKVWDMAARTVYCCETCQPLRLAAATTAAADAAGSSKPKGRSRSGPAAAAAGDATAAAVAQLLHPSRLKSMAAAKVAKEFVSHCAPDDPSDLLPSKMTCQQLRDHLRPLNLDTRGNKAQLVARLEAARSWMGAGPAGPAAGGADAAPAPAAAAAAAAGGGGGDSDTQVLRSGSSSSSEESGDELDRAEDALALRLSVPPAKRRRRIPTEQQQPPEVQDAAPPAKPSKAPARKPRSTTAAAAAAADGAGGGRASGGVASARAAAAEKAFAGENRAVEHVALHADDWTDQLMFGSGPDGTAGQAQQQQQQQPREEGMVEDVVVVGVVEAGTPAASRPSRRIRRTQQ